VKGVAYQSCRGMRVIFSFMVAIHHLASERFLSAKKSTDFDSENVRTMSLQASKCRTHSELLCSTDVLPIQVAQSTPHERLC
jgi:hypothetical protein